jgi:photosystem II stability/assembly factor-like uncharacterized protein
LTLIIFSTQERYLSRGKNHKLEIQEVKMCIRKATAILLVFFVTLVFVWQNLEASSQGKEKEVNSSIFQNLEWRNIGPANMCGRIADIEGVPGNSNIVYVGSASGGVWKTINGGTTWKPIFDDQPVASIGDIALEPGNPDVIYVGTGESNVRNSVSFGNGVYKSTDGGITWSHLGLEDTRHISRIIVHPRNPNIVYVGALGHAFGPNRERGVFMTTNGGKSWEKVLYTDEHHGVSDMDINLQNPNILYAALWHFERKPWTFSSGSEKGGVYRSIDGGSTWMKLSEGLPKLMGRIGVRVARSNPEVVYVIAESNEGTLFRSDNRGEKFKQVNKGRDIVSRGFYYTHIRVDPTEENRIYAVASRLFLSIDGGANFKPISPTTHVDYHAFWIDPEDPSRIWQGQDGGVAVSYDRGETWEYVNNFPVGQFYQIYADNREPFYFVGGGLQDNGTWYGPSRTREPAGILNDDWRMVSFGDGFFILANPENPELFISESQGGRMVRTNMETREQQDISPTLLKASGGPASTGKYRFNWNTPIISSPHDPQTIYVGGNVVFKSTDFGTTWKVISPDLTTNDPEKQKTAGSPGFNENTGAEFHCTIISLAASPVEAGILWAGTDDGNLQLSRDGGQNWENLTQNIPGIPPQSPVSHIEPSKVTAGLAYCSFDRHMLDDLHPYVYKTSDFGRTWENITGNLPHQAYVWVVKEDPKNPDILYAGTELGLYTSFKGGKSWMKFHMKNLPFVAVHDILIHPRENDLILGTHGRSIWILDDITFLQQMNKDVLEDAAFIFDPRPAVRFATKFTRYGIGDKVFRGSNTPYGALITYYLKDKPDKKEKIKLEILDSTGTVIRKIENFPQEAGLNRVAWDLHSQPPRKRREDEQERDFFRRGPRGPQVIPGTYTVRMSMDGKFYQEPIEIRLDSMLSVSEEALRKQHEYGLKLRDMLSLTNEKLRALDLIEEQLRERKKTAKKEEVKLSEEAVKVIEDHLKRIDALKSFLARPEQMTSLSESSRLQRKLQSLFNLIDSVNAGPTSVQIAYFEELKEELEKAMTQIEEYLTDGVVTLNNQLRELNVPVLLLPEQPKKSFP